MKKSESIAKTVEDNLNKKLTTRQKEFCRYYVEGIYSNAECARKAGYSPNVARFQASHLLSGKIYPQVVEYIQELQQEKERRYGVTLIGQLKRLSELSIKAEENNQYSASINAEKLRSALGGLTIDRRENIHSLDQMTKDDIVARLNQIQKQYPQLKTIEGEVKTIQKKDERVKLLETNKK